MLSTVGGGPPIGPGFKNNEFQMLGEGGEKLESSHDEIRQGIKGNPRRAPQVEFAAEAGHRLIRVQNGEVGSGE